MVDITLGTEAAMRTLKSWEADENTESLSDHRYIKILIDRKDKTDKNLGGMEFPRWNIKRMDRDWFSASVAWGSWMMEHKIGTLIKEDKIDKAEYALKRIISDACSNATTRIKGGGNTKKSKV